MVDETATATANDSVRVILRYSGSEPNTPTRANLRHAAEHSGPARRVVLRTIPAPPWPLTEVAAAFSQAAQGYTGLRGAVCAMRPARCFGTCINTPTRLH